MAEVEADLEVDAMELSVVMLVSCLSGQPPGLEVGDWKGSFCKRRCIVIWPKEQLLLRRPR